MWILESSLEIEAAFCVPTPISSHQLWVNLDWGLENSKYSWLGLPSIRDSIPEKGAL